MSEYYAVTRSTDHLAHYGVKGMKWGVRKAIAYGNKKKLDRHFRKAAKKLAKLQDIGLNSNKSYAKAAAYAAAAAGMGALTFKGGPKVRAYLKLLKNRNLADELSYMDAIGKARRTASQKPTLAQQKEIDQTIAQNLSKANMHKRRGEMVDKVNEWIDSPSIIAKGKLTKGQVVKIGTGIAAAGLAANAAKHLYRARNDAEYRERADQFKNAMDEAFAGTKYAGKYVVPPKKKKNRRKST